MKLLKVIVCGSGIFLLGALGVFWYESDKYLKQVEDKIKRNTSINNVDVSFKDFQTIQTSLESKFKEMESAVIRINIEGTEYLKTLKELGFGVSITPQELLKKMKAEQWSESYVERLLSLYQENVYDYEIEFFWSEESMKEWIGEMANEKNRSLILPTLTRKNGKFIVSKGEDAYSLDQEMLFEQLKAFCLDVINGETELNLSVDLVKVASYEEVERQLKSVNQVVSAYSSIYPIEDVNRTYNLELATKKINGTVLLPGEVFSFTEKVAPVTTGAGYRPATVFINGQPSTDIGGGICQLSSTIYNAQLIAGILPTERRNHSLRVYYVPIGQDATMYEGSIDYKFENTLDYPIYIEAVATDGMLTVSFWSNDTALNGIRYEPISVVSNDGLRADTTLYGYDESGNVVYQKFLHTSQYKG